MWFLPYCNVSFPFLHCCVRKHGSKRDLRQDFLKKLLLLPKIGNLFYYILSEIEHLLKSLNTSMRSKQLLDHSLAAIFLRDTIPMPMTQKRAYYKIITYLIVMSSFLNEDTTFTGFIYQFCYQIQFAYYLQMSLKIVQQELKSGMIYWVNMTLFNINHVF